MQLPKQSQKTWSQSTSRNRSMWNPTQRDLELPWAITDDNLQVCRGTNKEVEIPITHILSLVSSVFDPIGLFAAFSVHMRRLLKGFWTKNGQHWDNEVDPVDEADFLKRKEQLPIVAETSIDRTYFNRERDKAELHEFADASEDTMCAVAYLCVRNRRNTQLT